MSKSSRSSLATGGVTDFQKLALMARAEEMNQPKAPAKRQKTSKSSFKDFQNLRLHGSNDSAWVERYLPKSLGDHFVHKTKIAQFETWLNQAKGAKGSKMCLMTGPSGAGKTATVYLVAAELGYRVNEWLNPMSLTQFRVDGWKAKDSDEIQGRSQIDSFADFLLRASQYSPLPIKGKSASGSQSLVLVEDFPNFFYTDLPLLHQLMRNYQAAVDSPLVFVMTDSTSSDCSSFKLFPKPLLLELNVHEIALNPVATTFMTKFANCVLAQANAELTDGALLGDVIASAGGDMRSAINNLQFRLQTPQNGSDHRNSGPFSKKRRLNTNKESQSIDISKDESLFLFHALGKVLYAKREISDPETESSLKGNAVSYRRLRRLKEVPEEIGDKIGVSPETFFNFLGQNYFTFFSSLGDIVNASVYLADAAFIFSRWVMEDTNQSYSNNYDTREQFGLSLAIRGLMFSNQHPVSSSWKPLKKPRLREVSTVAETMIQHTRAFCLGPVTLDYYTDLVPYTALIRPKDITEEKRNFLNEFGLLRMNRRTTTGLLVEADGAGLDDTVSPEMVVTPTVQDVIDRANATEDYVIEEVID